MSDPATDRIIAEACLVRMGYSIADVRDLTEEELLGHAAVQAALNDLIREEREVAAWLSRFSGGR